MEDNKTTESLEEHVEMLRKELHARAEELELLKEQVRRASLTPFERVIEDIREIQDEWFDLQGLMDYHNKDSMQTPGLNVLLYRRNCQYPQYIGDPPTVVDAKGMASQLMRKASDIIILIDDIIDEEEQNNGRECK